MQTDVVRFFIDIPGSIAVAAAHHRRIAAAVRAKEADGAAASMEEHIAYTARMVGGMLRETAAGGERRPTPADA
jgi:DNA-binding FadR family transcriptional regulator